LVTGEAPSTYDRLPYLVMDISPSVLAVTEKLPISTLGSRFTERGGPANLRLGVGDIVSVTIFEAASGGLFIPTDAGSRPGNFITLPSQEISRNGTISVPFAGEVTATNRTPQEVQATIEQRLRNRAIEPQAVVSLVEARSSLVSVTGEVSQPVRFAISRSGDRILDALTRAGGSRWPPHETYVLLQRGGKTASVYFNLLARSPENNIYLRPGDTIVVRREARTFMALGASGQNGQINFDQEELKLSEAIGRAGSVLDSRGDPAQTFIYRLENRKVVEQLGHDVSQFSGPMIPVVYRINLREPQGFFLATKFPVQPKDILFVSNAPSVELAKVLNIIQLAANTVTDSDLARISIKSGRR
jgi:polysaccharide biosynthesis/export protein